MALAQETGTLLLDEPTTFLDLAHQIEVLQLLYRLNRDEGRRILMVLHDLNNAARYSHRIVALSKGGIFDAGSPVEVVTPRLLRDVFGVEAEVVPDPRTGLPLCVPYGLSADTNGEGPEAPACRGSGLEDLLGALPADRPAGRYQGQRLPGLLYFSFWRQR